MFRIGSIGIEIKMNQKIKVFSYWHEFTTLVITDGHQKDI